MFLWNLFGEHYPYFSRGLDIFVIGSIFFPIFNQPYGIFKWSVFQVIGLGYIFGFFVRNSIVKKLISIIGIFILSIFISNFQIEALYFLIKGFLPLIPYLSYFILGQLLYEIYKNHNLSLKRNRKLIYLFINFPYF